MEPPKVIDFENDEIIWEYTFSKDKLKINDNEDTKIASNIDHKEFQSYQTTVSKTNALITKI